MTMLRTPLLILALATCDSANQPPAPAPPVDEPTPAPRSAVRSCPAAAAAVDKIDFDPRISLGDHAGVTWLFGYAAGEPVLAHLGADDRLALTPVPLRHAAVGAIDGPRIWLLAPRALSSPSSGPDTPASWLSVDITDPERPVPSAALPLGGPDLFNPTHLAVGKQRALVIAGLNNDPELTLLDTTTLAPVAPPHSLASLSPLHAFCSDDRCSLVALEHTPTEEPMNHPVVVRVLPDGAREQEPLTTEWSGNHQVARHGDQLLVAWTTTNGIRLRALGRDGRPLAPSVPVPWDSKRWIRDILLVQGDGAVVLAVGEQNRWSTAVVGPHGNPGPLRELPGAARHFLFAAPLADGIAWVNLTGEVSYDDLGSFMMHSWQADAAAGFLPNSGAATPPVELVKLMGDGRGTLEPHLLTRPGAAAAFTMPRGDAALYTTPTFALLRATCRPEPAAVPVNTAHPATPPTPSSQPPTSSPPLPTPATPPLPTPATPPLPTPATPPLPAPATPPLPTPATPPLPTPATPPLPTPATPPTCRL